MKRYISGILTLLAVVATISASAQEQKKMVWGVKAGAGIAYSSLHGDDTEGRENYRKPIFSYSAGATAEYKFNKDISLSAEALFSQQGVNYKYPTVNGNNYDGENYTDASTCKVKHRFSYINVPIIFNYYFVKNVNISLNVGVQMGFMVGENSTTEFTYYMDGKSVEVDGAYGWDLFPDKSCNGGYVRNDAGYKVFDLGVPMGITWGFTENISLDIRYTLGVLNTFKPTTDYKYDNDFRSTNNNVILSVGYKF